MPVTESNVFGLWIAKQTAGRGTPAPTAIKKLLQVGGDVDLNVTHGSENYSDGDRFGNSTDYVDAISGGGSPVIEAQSDVVAYLCNLFFGQEAFTAKVGGASPPKFVFEPGSTAGYWATVWKSLGLTAKVRQKFNDTRLTSLRIEGSTANKIVKITPTFLSLDAGEFITADPVVALSTQAPFLYNEGAGTFTIDGTVYRGQSQFAIVFDNAETVVPGDDIRPYDVQVGNAQITLDAITLALDGASYAQYCKQVYGTATPANGDRPISQMPSIGSYTANLRKTKGANGAARALDAVESLKIEVGGVHWTPDVAMAPNPDGGLIELPFAGQMRKNPSGGVAPAAPVLARVTVETGAGDNAAHA